MLTWTADNEKQMSRCNKQMLSMLFRLNKSALADSDLRQCLGSCMHVDFLDAALKLPKACELEHDTHMFAIVAILRLKFGLKMKTKIMITDAAQVKNCFELARASSVPRLAL